MSMTNPTTTGPAVRGNASDSFGRLRGGWLETKPFLATSEFWLTVVGIVAVLIAGYVVDDPTFSIFRAWLMATILASAYILSRGMAKAGSGHTADDR